MSTNNSLNINSSTPLDLPRGGSSASLTASIGGLVYSSASAMAILAGTATAHQIPLSGASAAPAWSTATYLPTLVANNFLYASATNVMAQLATANSAMIVTSAAGVPAMSATMTNGQLIMGSTGATPVAASIIAGTGINVIPGAGSLTIASTVTGISWVDQTSSPVTAIINHGYVTDLGVTQVVYNLPSAPALGSIVEISGFSAGGWQIIPGAGDTIQIGSVNAATSVTSSNQYDTISLLYTSSLWVLQNGVSGGYTIV